MDIYTTLFDQEFVINRHVRSECRKAEERGEARGERRGEKRGQIMAYNDVGMPAEEIASRTGYSKDEISSILSEIGG